VIASVVAVQRDFGNRSDRKVARLKYLVADWGIERFRDKVASYAGRPLDPARNVQIEGHDDHLGWGEQGDGNFFYGLNVENGRIADTERHRLKSALRTICQQLTPGIRLTAHQSILFTDLTAGHRSDLQRILREHGVALSGEISQVRRWSMACVAWPTCGLSITEAERALPGLIDQLETRLDQLGLADEKFTLRMTGCPNGCARPYNPDIGLVGKAKGKYTVFLGGRRQGDRLAILYQDMVAEADLVDELTTVFTCFQQHKQDGESLGDFCHRVGVPALLEFRTTGHLTRMHAAT
jgi:sulfite reductase (ferredoxin)